MRYYPEPPEGGGEPAQSAEPADESTDYSSATLIPKSIFGGRELKPGDTVEFKVTHVYEEDVEIQPASEGTSEEPSPADNQIDQMASQNQMPMMEGM